MKPNETKVYGRSAVKAIFKLRPAAVIRLYVDKSKLSNWKTEMAYCSKNKLAYHLVTPEDLCKVADTTHHEGVCALIRKPHTPSLDDIVNGSGTDSDLVVWLDHIGNSHNVGNIVRTMAHYGISKALSTELSIGDVPPSAMRVGEGGFEWVQLAKAPISKETFGAMRKLNYRVVGTHCSKGHSIFDYSFPGRTILILGGESDGISENTAGLCDDLVTIPQVLTIQSLNVASAAAIFIHEWTRQIKHRHP